MNVLIRTFAVAFVATIGFFGARAFHAQNTTAGNGSPAAPKTIIKGTLPAASQITTASGESIAFSIEALRKILADESPLRKSGQLKRIFDSIPADNYAAIYAEIVKAGVEMTELLPIFFASWRDKDPAAAVARGESLLGTKDAPVFRRTFAYFATKDWAAAKKFAERFPAAEQKSAMAMLDRMDPSRPAPPPPSPVSPRDRFWKSVEITPHSFSSKGPYQAILREWALGDPEGAAKEILGSPALRNYSDILRVVYEAWKSKDADGAARFVAGLTFDERRRMIARIAEDLAVKDVAMAQKTAEILTDPSERAYALSSIGQRLAQADPSVAPEWIRITAEADPTFVTASLFGIWFKHDPANAAKALLEDKAYQEFLKKFPEESLVGGYIDLLPFAEKDPQEAAQFMTKLPKRDLPRSLSRMAENWAKKDGDAALRWAQSIPSGPAHDEAQRQFTYSVAKHNANRATQHLESLPTGSAKSAGIEGFAFATFDVDPDAVLVWVRGIPDEQQRLDVLGRAWSDWSRRNKRAAQDWARNVAQFQPVERAALEERGAF